MEKESVEWEKLKELEDVMDELTPKQRERVEGWLIYLDPFTPFLSQQSVAQWQYLNWLHAKVVEGNEEKARGYYD